MSAGMSWGIAGCGWVARDYVGPAIAASSNGHIAALYDPDPASLAAATALFAAPTTQDLANFLATPGLDAVYIAAPNHVHRPLVEAAAAAGKHVLCEKPMAITLEDAHAMVNACTRAGVRYGTAFDQRHHAAHQHLRNLIATGAAGTVTAIRIVYACWLPAGWAPDATSTDNWRIDPARAGGGALMDLAPHGLDLCAYLLDESIIRVTAMGQSRVQNYAVEDGALLMAQSRSGVLIQLHVAYNVPDALPRRRLEVVGTTGQIVALDTMGQTAGGTLTVIDAGTGHGTRVAVHGDDRSPFLNQVEAFASGSPLFNGAHDLHTMALVLDAQRQATPPKVPHAA